MAGFRWRNWQVPLRAGALWKLTLPTWPASSPTTLSTEPTQAHGLPAGPEPGELHPLLPTVIRQVTSGHQSKVISGENKRKQILEMVTRGQMGLDISADAGERDAGVGVRWDTVLSADASPEW